LLAIYRQPYQPVPDGTGTGCAGEPFERTPAKVQN
jgi:hypothetical protein